MNRNHIVFMTLSVITVLLAACGAPASAVPTSNPAALPTTGPTAVSEIADPESIAQEFYRAVNEADIEGAMALVADDIKCRGVCYLNGKEAFRFYIQGSINTGGGGGRVDLSELQVEGDIVRYRWEAYNKDGNFVASGTEVLEIQDGKIILMETQSGNAPAAP